jgi:hypothetical protein
MAGRPFVVLPANPHASAKQLHRRWVVITGEGQRRAVYRALGATHAEMRALFPDARSLEPVPDRPVAGAPSV